MIAVFSILAIVLIYFSFRSFRGGINYLNYFADQITRERSKWKPFTTVIVPCKGLDQDLEKNLASFLCQEYAEYETIFVVDDERDPAVAVINGLRETDHPCKAIKLILAQKAVDSGQKVENLREAVLHADERSSVFVFADSDARPLPDWLDHLTAPLADKNIGTVTGYRWFISEKKNFASELRSAWNASIASTLGADTKNNLCWGGSMAIRREVFEDLDIRSRWKGTVSDDFIVRRVMRDADLAIHFAPKALAASIGDCTFSELIKFTNRQMKLTRVYSRDLWLMSFVGSGLFCLVMTAALFIAAFSRTDSFAFWAAIATLFTVIILGVGKAWFRLSAVRMALPEHSDHLKQQMLSQLTLWVAAQPLYLLNCLSALFSTQITWRGIKYELRSSDLTVIIRPEGE